MYTPWPSTDPPPETQRYKGVSHIPCRRTLYPPTQRYKGVSHTYITRTLKITPTSSPLPFRGVHPYTGRDVADTGIQTQDWSPQLWNRIRIREDLRDPELDTRAWSFSVFHRNQLGVSWAELTFNKTVNSYTGFSPLHSACTGRVKTNPGPWVTD